MKPYPYDVCLDCGKKYRNAGHPDYATMITMSYGTCEVCGEKETSVTTPGDFGWPDFPGHEKLKHNPIYGWD